MSDASTSNEVGKNNLLENYSGENINPVFYALDINLEKLKGSDGNPNSGVVEVLPREAGELDDMRLIVGEMPPVSIPVVNIRGDEEKENAKAAISRKAEQNGGIGLNKGGVVELKTNPEKYQGKDRDI